MLSPGSQVRFEEEESRQSSQHTPHFMFDRGEWSDSENEDSRGRERDQEGGEGAEASDKTILPTEAQMVLLCLDYLRDLRRSYPHHADDLANAEGLHPDYISLAAWSLSRAFLRPEKLRHGSARVSTVTEVEGAGKKKKVFDVRFLGGGGLAGPDDEQVGNDAWYRQLLDEDENEAADAGGGAGPPYSLPDSDVALPTSMQEVTNEVLLLCPGEGAREKNSAGGSSRDEEDGEDADDEYYYELNDAHPSNGHRFYLLNGLASESSMSGAPASPSEMLASPRLGGAASPAAAAGGSSTMLGRVHGLPLSMAEVVSAGLAALRARSRIEAEKEMVTSPLFRQFVSAATAGGFFQERGGAERKRGGGTGGGDGDATAGPLSPEEGERRSRAAYEEKYRKIVSKFRTKLAAKEAHALFGSGSERQAPSPFGGRDSRRVSSAYRIMSGGASVASGGGGGNYVDAGLSESLVLGVRDVSDRQRRRRERRTERVRPMRRTRVVTVAEDEPEQIPALSSPSRLMSPMKRVSFSEQAAATKVAALALRDDEGKEEEAADVGPRASSPAKGSGIGAAQDDVINLPHYQEAERLNSEGNALMKSRDFASAIETYTAAINLAPAGPNSHVYYSNRSAAYLSLNSVDESVRDGLASTALRPTYAKAHSRLGLAHFAAGRYREAIGSYKRSLDIDPGNKWTLDHLRRAEDKLASTAGGDGGVLSNDEKEGAPVGKDPPGADDDEDNWPTPFDEENENDSEAVGGIGGSEDPEGDAPAEEEGAEAGGGHEDEEASAERTRRADRHKDKGNEHMSNKLYKLALEEYNLAISTSPDGPNSHVYYSNRAAAHCYLASYAAASEDCRTSMGLNPTYEKAHARLGLSLFFRGDYEGAVEAYEGSLRLDPKNMASRSYLEKARARLAEQKRDAQSVDEDGEGAGEQPSGDENAGQQQDGIERGREDAAGEHDVEYPEEDDADSVGDRTGITSTGLTSIVTNDNDDVNESIEVVEEDVAAVASVDEEDEEEHWEEQQQEQQQHQQEAFDPFDTTDDEI